MSNNFGEWLREQIKLSGKTQSEFADVIGIEQPHLSRIINGGRNASNQVLENIAVVLGLPPEKIFRQAGILRPKPEIDQKIEDINHLMRDLPPEELEEIELIIRMKLNRQGTNKRGRKNAARSLLKG